MKTTRDEQIIRLVGQFQQLTSHQIKQLVFHDVSDTPRDRALERLCDDRYLVRVGRKLIRDLRGGSGAYVYALGRAGWNHLYTGKYRVRSVPYPHLLDIADAYIALVQAEREGKLEITKIRTEPATSVTIGGQLLKPDLSVRYKVPGKGELSLYLEIDKATEHRGQMAAMFERYRQAFLNYDSDMSVFPLIVVLVRSDLVPEHERIAELRQLIRLIPDETKDLFRVDTLDTFPQSWLL